MALGAFVLACVGVVSLTPLRDAVSDEGRLRLRDQMRELGAWAPWAFLLLNIVGVAIGVPRIALAALGGLLFDWVLGAALAQAGSTIGCWITFAVGRALGRDSIGAWVRRRFPRAGTLLDFIGRHGFAANVLVRLLPVGNAFATNLLMAVSTCSTASFVVGGFVGSLPSTVIFAIGGSAALAPDPALRLTISAVAMAIVGLGAWWWARRSRLRV